MNRPLKLGEITSDFGIVVRHSTDTSLVRGTELHVDSRTISKSNSEAENIICIDRKIESIKEKYRGNLNYRILDGVQLWAGCIALVGGLVVGGLVINSGEIVSWESLMKLIFAASIMYAGYFTIIHKGEQSSKEKKQQQSEIEPYLIARKTLLKGVGGKT